ncbi:efflux RND transporter periplasmic adaptor subunit [Myroides sp. LJL115]
MKRFVFKVMVGFLGFFLTFCSKKQEQVQDSVAFTIENQIINIPEDSNLRSRLKMDTVIQKDFSFNLVTAGLVKAIPNKYAEVASPFSGRILKSSIKLGQKVEAGTVLFEVSSPEFYQTQKEYLDSQQEYNQAVLDFDRQKDLLDNGVGILQEFEQAQTQKSIARVAFDNAIAAMKIYDVDVKNLRLGQPLKVSSPIQGEVIEDNIVIGQYIQQDSEPVVKVASLNKIWIVGKIKEKDLLHLTRLNKVQVELAAMPDTPLIGEIYHISEIVDEQTRSIDVLIEVDNTQRILKPGMYVSVRFIDKPQKVLLVPTSAIMQGEKDSFVFVEIAPFEFVRKNVIIGGVDQDNTVITSGLLPEDVVVSQGGIYLPKLH